MSDVVFTVDTRDVTGSDGTASLLLLVDVGHFIVLVNRVPGTVQLNFPVDM